MAVEKLLKTRSLSIEVENGIDKDGNPVYKKKTFSNVKTNVEDDKIYAVAEGIKAVLKDNTRDYFINDISVIQN